MIDALDLFNERKGRFGFASGTHDRRYVLRETRAAIARARVQELVADTTVFANRAGDFLHVGTDFFAQVCDFIDEADLHGEEGVGCILSEFGRLARDKHHRRAAQG